MQYAPTMPGRSTNAGRGLQPRLKRLDAPKRRYITKSRHVSSVIFQR
jgi:hypothetical protein